MYLSFEKTFWGHGNRFTAQNWILKLKKSSKIGHFGPFLGALMPLQNESKSLRVKYSGIRKLLVKLVQTNKFVDSFDLV